MAMVAAGREVLASLGGFDVFDIGEGSLSVERDGQRRAVISTWENWDGSQHFDVYVNGYFVGCSSLSEALEYAVSILDR